MKTFTLALGLMFVAAAVPACAVEDTTGPDDVVGSQTSTVNEVPVTVVAHSSGDVDATFSPVGQPSAQIRFTAAELKSKGFGTVASLHDTQETQSFLTVASHAAYARWRTQLESSKATVEPKVVGYCDSHTNYCCGYCSGWDALACCVMCTKADPCSLL
jgi:hypothetical protein